MDNRSACEVFISHDELANCCISAYDLTEEDTLAARQAASDVLAYLSAWTIFGTCTAVVRPVGRFCLDGRDAIPLTWPVRAINSVWIDGVELTESQYALVDKKYLIRTDCLSLPCDQNIGKARTELNTFEIDYDFGTDIPYIAKPAAIELACDYQNGCAGGACRLPRTATSLSQQGMSLNLAADEASDAVRRGEFPDVAKFVAIYNPNGIVVPTMVYSPDMPKLRTVEYFPSA